MPPDSPMDRRRFFRRGLAELLRPLASSIAPLERVANKIGELDAAAAARSGQQPNKILADLWLRPPGAISESKFLATCSRGGECVNACPAHCIKIDTTGTSGKGAPYIDADTTACVVCSGLHCMRVCPSGALVPTALADIDMGTAVWREERCLRTTGEQCQICVDECPLGEMAITLKNGKVAVNPLGCIGCGICQQHCPTSPKSISVIPKAAKES
ncbi:MAG TPA: 4Fe-4S dicluster domain-containing protein [Tepidisphaeraceae bacterium]|nr:4Fe-4S dicluster domain-containing protein [Tepidisphaeraceae bacterium]